MGTVTNTVLYLATINLVAGLYYPGYHQNTEAPVDVGVAKIIDAAGPYHQDNSPEKVIDGDLNSKWNPIGYGRNHNNWYITFELDTSYAVTKVQLVNHGDRTHDITNFKLEASDDNVNWYMSGSKHGVTVGSSEWQSFDGFAATGKYLRFTITRTYSGWQPYLQEISFTGYPQEAPVDVGVAMIIDSAGPYHQDMSPEKVIDGDLNSHWNPMGYGRYHNNWFITFELDASYVVNRVQLVNSGDRTHDITSFKLEVSQDNVNWYMSGNKDGVTVGSSEWQSFDGFAATGKYLRFTITSTYSGWQPYLQEIRFAGYPQGCKSPFTAIGSSCLTFVNELAVDHTEADLICNAAGGHLAIIDTAQKLHDIVDYINSNYSSIQQSYWIDGGRDTGNQWSFENIGVELPMGTPFWGTSKNDGSPDHSWLQRPSDNSGNCLTISYNNSYYFTESMCGSNLPSPLCEQEGTSDYDVTRGTIVSTNYPSPYPDNEDTQWTVITEETATLTVRFERFWTETSYDYLIIRDGIDDTAPELIHLTGSYDPWSISEWSIGEVKSTGNSLYFHFHSDDSISYSGFKLHWSASTESAITDITCPPFYTPVGKDCFAFVFIPMSFNEAKMTCASMNGQLGVIANAEQLRSLYLYIHDLGIAHVSFWLGGSDKNDEGHFIYEDGTEVPQGTPFWGTTGENSEVQEPNGSEEENCVALVAEGSHFLRDVQCSTQMKFLCTPL